MICYNPDAAQRDAAVRERLIAQLTDKIDGSDKLNATKRAELRGVISTKPGLNRYLRVTPKGRTELSQPQKALFAKLRVAEPPRVIDAIPATA